MLAVIRLHHHTRQRPALFLLLLLLVFCAVAEKNQVDNFCRRFSHQSTVIGDRLYIDGGYLNYQGFANDPKNYSNTWLAYHDLSTPQFELKTDLNKPDSIPTVAGGILWPDTVKNKFYLYGGERIIEGPVDEYKLLSYDISKDEWDDLGQPTISPNVSSYGAGVGVSDTGLGYYYGGWISNGSMSAWTQNRTMSSNFYSYNYDDERFSPEESPDDYPRAEGGMVWIPAGDHKGLLVYMGGVVSRDGDDISPQSFDEILVFEPTQGKWYKQNTTGQVPQNRRQFCMDVAWAPDRSSYNIYLFGGQDVPVDPPVSNETAYSDVYILSLPSFVWIKIIPGTPGNSTGTENNRYGSSCNMLKGMSQFAVIGGTYTKHDKCMAENWDAHNLWTGTYGNAGDNGTYWLGFDPKFDSNVVPFAVYNVVGGDKNGGATKREPEKGFNSGDLDVLFRRNIAIPKRGDKRSKLGTGAIVGIAIGCAVALALIGYLWYRCGKRVVERREQRRQPQATQQTQQTHQDHYMQQPPQMQQNHYAQQTQQMQYAQLSHQSFYGGSTAGTQSLVTPQSPPSNWNVGTPPTSPNTHPPMELPADGGNAVMEYKPIEYSGDHQTR